MPNLNVNCCGGECRQPHGEVRMYPLGGGGNLILCQACWAHENRYRFERQSDYLRLARRDALRSHPRGVPSALREKAQKEAAESWPQHDWFKAKVYDNGEG